MPKEESFELPVEETSNVGRGVFKSAESLKPISRREFLKASLAAGLALGTLAGGGSLIVRALEKTQGQNNGAQSSEMGVREDEVSDEVATKIAETVEVSNSEDADNQPEVPYKPGENYTFDQVANYMAEPGELGALYNYDSAKKFEEGVLVGQVSGFYPVFVDGEWMYRLIDATKMDK